MTSFTAEAALPYAAPLDPSKHVNYTLGMVLGVDDFRQEFAYLAGRDRLLASQLIGFGVSSGLRLEIEESGDPPGPRVRVSPGVAVLPSGQLVCVSPAQCAELNEWLEAERSEVERISSPPPAEIGVGVVLCYADCATDEVPIPGEPCRSEENLMAPSRLRDHFRLELTLDPPRHLEEEAVRDFVLWLRQVPLTEGPGDLEAFLAALREAARPVEPGESPPQPPLDFLYGSPPAGVEIPRARACEFLSEAFALWTAELRGRWRLPVPGCDPKPTEVGEHEDCLLLGELVVPLSHDVVADELTVDDVRDVEVDYSRRPTLLHLRMLQEWLLCGPGPAPATTPVPSPPSSPLRAEVVGGAYVDAAGSSAPAPLFQDGLTVTKLDDHVFHLAIPGFDPQDAYVVKAIAITALSDGDPHHVEVVDPGDADLAALVAGAGVDPGLGVRVRRTSGDPTKWGLMVEVSRYGGGP